MKTKIIYLHGFGGIGHGENYHTLVDTFGGQNVVAPDLFITPDIVEPQIDRIVLECAIASTTPIFVGISLGGFWANYMAHKWKKPCVIVNPATAPSDNMRYVRGLTLCNFVTGMPFNIPFDVVPKFAAREKLLYSRIGEGKLIHLFVAKDDLVLDYSNTLDKLPNTASTTVFDGGGHRFERHWGKVVSTIGRVYETSNGN